jgi:hypothetical protein
MIHPHHLSQRVRPGVEAAPWVAEEILRLELQRQQAIDYLHLLLNDRRTATQAWDVEQAARDWLTNIGSEPQ